MKKHLFSLAIIGMLFFAGYTQNLNTPAEIFKIMEESSVMYEIQILEKEILPPDRTNLLNYNDVYRVKENNNYIVINYDVSGSTASYASKAEEYFEKKDYANARNMYLQALAIDSTYYEIMTYLGQTYYIEGDYENAINWYEKVIKLNFIDYMAHWFLADALSLKGDTERALDEITIAMILNRNNPRIKKSFDRIYESKKLKTTHWVFNPQMEIGLVDENKVKISFAEDWLSYAMAKAVWNFEPGYKEKKGVAKESYSSLEEKEAIAGLYLTMDKKKQKKLPEFKALSLAIDKKMLDEYIIYEIMLPDHPSIVYQLTEETILGIKEYVKTVRGGLK